jgi:ABC-type glycerol-3-phosphate transport system substrate-binding protein
MKRTMLLSAVLGSMVMLAAACGGSSGNAGANANGTAGTTQATTQETRRETTHAAYFPRIHPADFSTKIDNE